MNDIVHVGVAYVARNGQVRFVTLSNVIDLRYDLVCKTLIFVCS